MGAPQTGFACRAFGSIQRRPVRPDVVAPELTPKHRIRYTLRLSLQGRGGLRLNLTPHRRRNRTIRRTIRDTLECVCNSRQLECHLVRSVRPLQHDNLFPAEVKSGPKHKPNHHRYTRHKHVVTCDTDASTRDSNYVIREQRFLPVGVNGSPACTLMENRIGSATSSGFRRAASAMSAALQRGLCGQRLRQEYGPQPNRGATA
jgi:hypothetical protein